MAWQSPCHMPRFIRRERRVTPHLESRFLEKRCCGKD